MQLKRGDTNPSKGSQEEGSFQREVIVSDHFQPRSGAIQCVAWDHAALNLILSPRVLLTAHHFASHPPRPAALDV
jgi:hypothetical protein